MSPMIKSNARVTTFFPPPYLLINTVPNLQNELEYLKSPSLLHNLESMYFRVLILYETGPHSFLGSTNNLPYKALEISNEAPKSKPPSFFGKQNSDQETQC